VVKGPSSAELQPRLNILRAAVADILKTNEQAVVGVCARATASREITFRLLFAHAWGIETVAMNDHNPSRAIRPVTISQAASKLTSTTNTLTTAVDTFITSRIGIAVIVFNVILVIILCGCVCSIMGTGLWRCLVWPFVSAWSCAASLYCRSRKILNGFARQISRHIRSPEILFDATQNQNTTRRANPDDPRPCRGVNSASERYFQDLPSSMRQNLSATGHGDDIVSPRTQQRSLPVDRSDSRPRLDIHIRPHRVGNSPPRVHRPPTGTPAVRGRHHNPATLQVQRQHQQIRADPAEIASFIVHESKAGEQCPVCLGLLAEEFVSVCPCSHMFHSSCLRSWLAKKETCPICRVAFVETRPVVALG
jgi:Ring finger domain